MEITNRVIASCFVSRRYIRKTNDINNGDHELNYIHFGAPLPFTIKKIQRPRTGFETLYDMDIEKYICPFIIPGISNDIQSAYGVDGMTAFCNAMANAWKIIQKQEWFSDIIPDKFYENIGLLQWPYELENRCHKSIENDLINVINNNVYSYSILQKEYLLEKQNPFFIHRTIRRKLQNNNIMIYNIYFDVPYYRATLNPNDYSVIQQYDKEILHAVCKFVMPGISNEEHMVLGYDSMIALKEAIIRAGQILKNVEWYDEIIQDISYENLGFPL